MRHYTRAEMEQVYNHIVGERLPGRGPQRIHELSTVQRYQIGSRLQVGIKVFHYALVGVGANGLEVGMGAKVRNPQDIGFSAIPALGARVAGAMTLLLTIGAGDGPARNGSFPVNYLRGGHAIIRTGGGVDINIGIAGNPVKAALAGTLLVQLETPLPAPVAVLDQQEVMASPYANVVDHADIVAAQEWNPIVGMPMMITPAGSYTWLQTWGPYVAICAAEVGAAVSRLAVYAAGNGSLDAHANQAGIQQYVGYVACTGGDAGGQGAPFVFLQLDP